MALSRARKQEIVESYGQGLATATHAFLLSYKGASVPQVTDLRAKVRQKGGKYLVVKNTLALRAVEGGALKALETHFTGPTAVVYGNDPVAIAKVLNDFIKDAPAFEFKVALVDGQVVAAAQIKELAMLPSREELIAKLLGTMQAPIAKLVRTMNEVPGKFVRTLAAVKDAKPAT